MAKKIQTDYTRGGRDISNTAIPLYQDTLRAMGDYNNNTQGYIDSYLDKYYGADTARNNDFLRNYNRAMSNRTASNYSATGGGYSSAGQRAYDDSQRYYNDLASRMYDQGVSTSAQMAQNYYNNLLNGAGIYHNAYGLGKDYSDIQQYNNGVKQNNSWTNQLGQNMGTIGGAIGSIWGPVGGMIGQAAGNAIGGAMTVDTSGITGAGSSANSATQDNSGLFAGVSAMTRGKFWDKLGNSKQVSSTTTQAVQDTAPRSDGYYNNFSLFKKGK